jgi:Protein of unknown function (DUF2945).
VRLGTIPETVDGMTRKRRSRPANRGPLRRGDHVEWSSHGGTAKGRVERRITAPMDIKGHHVAASPENPEYLVRSDRTGGVAAHKREALRKSSIAGEPKRTKG